ncbi:MAG: MarR family transcriptional regulator [Alphaproteobacteria bacterium]
MNIGLPPQDYEAAAAQDDTLDLRVWLRLLSCANMIEAEIRRRLRREFGVTLPWFDAVAQLYREADGLTMSALSRRLMVTNGNATSLVDRLVAQGHATRKPDPQDQRVQRVRLTRKGRAAFERMHPAHRHWISELMGGTGQSDLGRLHGLLATLKGSIAQSLESVSSNAESRPT